MAITYSSGVFTITSSETPVSIWNADQLNGWGGVARVGNSKYWYDMGTSRIVVASGGTLTCTEAAGTLVFGATADSTNALKIQSGGTLVIGTTSSVARLLDFTKTSTGSYYIYDDAYACILAEVGSTVTWNAGEVQTHGGIVAYGTFTIASQNCKITNEGNLTNSAGNGPQFRMKSSNLSIGGLSAYGFTFTYANSSVPALLTNLKSRTSDQGFTLGGTYPANTFAGQPKGADLTDGITVPLVCWGSAWLRIINYINGSDVVCAGNIISSTTINTGLWEICQEVKFFLADGAKAYCKDTDNGARLAANQIGTNASYASDRTYTLTASGGYAEYTTNGGVLLAVKGQKAGNNTRYQNLFADYRGNSNNATDLFTWLFVEFGRQPSVNIYTLKGTTQFTATPQSLPDLGITEATKATVASYTGITPVYSGGILTVTVTVNHTWDEVYDNIKYWESENPSSVWANGKQSFVETANKLSYVYRNLVVVVNGCELTADGQTLPTKPTVGVGGFFEDADGAIWNDNGTLRYLKNVHEQAKDLATDTAQQYAVFAVFDESGVDRTYNSSLENGGLTSAADGKVSGYYEWKTVTTVHTLTKYILCYKFDPYIVPVEASGAPIGSSSSYNVNRLVDDDTTTLDRSGAGAISGVTATSATSVLDLADNDLSESMDNLKLRQSSTSTIETGKKGYVSFYEQGWLLDFDGTYYFASDGWLIRNADITAPIKGSIVEFDTPGTVSGKTFHNIQINCEADGTFDFRLSTFTGTLDVDTVGDYTVVAQFPTDAPTPTNNDPTNITIEQNEAFPIVGANIADGSQVFIHNVTQNEYLASGHIVSGGSGLSLSFTFGTGEEIESGDEIVIVADKYTKKTVRVERTASSGGIIFNNAQENCEICSVYAISESTALAIDKFIEDGDNIEIDFDGVGTFPWGVDELFVWAMARMANSSLFQKVFTGLFDASSNYGKIVVDTDMVDLLLDNPNVGTQAKQTNTNPNITGRPALVRKDGETIISDRTDGGSIQLDPDPVVVAIVNTNGSVVIEQGATPAEIRDEIDRNSTKLEAIKEKTDRIKDESQVSTEDDVVAMS